MDRLGEDSAVLASAKEHARAWAGAALADAVRQGIDEDADAVDPAVLLAAFAAGGLQMGDDEYEDDEEDDEGEDGGEEIDISLEAANVCEQLVGAVLDQQQPDSPRRIIAPLVELNNDEGGRLIAMLIGKAMGYLVSMRDAGVTPEQLTTAVNWLGSRFGAECAGPAAVASSLAGHSEGQDILVKHFGVKHAAMGQLVDLLDVDFFPAMIWLCAGMVATAGAGDVRWLREPRL
jgi:hypothetical protein